MEQSDQDSATRATKSVAKSNSTTPGVNIVNTKTEDLSIRLDDSGESFVELPDGDIRLLEPGLLEEFLDY